MSTALRARMRSTHLQIVPPNLALLLAGPSEIAPLLAPLAGRPL